MAFTSQVNLLNVFPDVDIETTTFLPEMFMDEKDNATLTISRGPKTLDEEECCKCPSVKTSEETSTIKMSTEISDEDETTTEILSAESDSMKIRGGRVFGGADLLNNEIDDTTPKMSTTTETSSEVDLDDSKIFLSIIKSFFLGLVPYLKIT